MASRVRRAQGKMERPLVKLIGHEHGNEMVICTYCYVNPISMLLESSHGLTFRFVVRASDVVPFFNNAAEVSTGLDCSLLGAIRNT